MSNIKIVAVIGTGVIGAGWIIRCLAHNKIVHAFDKEMAVQNARDLYTRRGEGKGMWVVPASSIVAVNPSDDQSFFEPADDKVYRHPTFYELPDGIKNM